MADHLYYQDRLSRAGDDERTSIQRPKTPANIDVHGMSPVTSQSTLAAGGTVVNSIDDHAR